MKKRTILFTIFIISSVLSINCGTIVKGYEDTIILENAPDSIRVVTKDGVEIPVRNSIIKTEKGDDSDILIDKPVKQISLRCNQEYTLRLIYRQKEKVITIYPKIGFRWAFYDFLFGVFPSFYDAYTGGWNVFPNIDASF